ncbi:MAG: hypothetical protein U9R49_02290 [Bacteroidota bacterium]|nr:hypothetical protein [Bacteroidota bacterium]
MKRDPHISKLIKESGVVSAPGNFTDRVMDKIEAVPVKKAYKPLIGRGGRIVIILFIVAVIVLAVLYTDPGGELFGTSIKIPQLEPNWPQVQFNLDFLKQINISTGIVSALVAMFVLVLSDAGMKRHRLSH